MTKKKTTIIILSLSIVISMILCACSEMFGDATSGSIEQPSSTDQNQDATAKIRELEAQIVAILQDQQLSQTQSKKEIEELRAAIEKLKNDKSADAATDVSTDKPAEEETFKYAVIDGRACITQIISTEKNIVIPYTIDGYKVYSIGSEALSSSTVESIVISSGIEKIDWFAFKNCPSLSSVSIPDTVISIGYGAFDNASSSFVIRCSRDSFAHRYAKSYGITYDIS